MHIPVLVRDVWRIARRLFGSRRAIAALMLGVMVVDCGDAILDHASTEATTPTSVARAGADAPSDLRAARPSHVSSATSQSRRAPMQESVPASRTPHAPCPCASAVPLTLAPELPKLATRDDTSRPAPDDFTPPLGPAPELRLRPPLARLS